MNTIVATMIPLMLTGGALGLLYKVPQHIWDFCQRKFLVQLDVMDTDPVFDWLVLWLDKHPYSKKARLLTASTVGNSYSSEPNAPSSRDKSSLPQPMFAPGPGWHLFWYKRRPVWFIRWRQEGASAATNRRVECFHFRIPGRDPQILKDMVEDARMVAEEKRRKQVSAYAARYGAWQKVGDYLPRSLESVILDKGVKERIVEVISEFFDKKDWYREMGIPWHLNLLITGPPGTGKTSVLKAIAGALNMNLYAMNLSSFGMDDERLAHLVGETQPRSLVVLEDIDCTTKSREGKDGNTDGSSVTLSGLLNTLDGVMTPEGSVTAMTSNYRDRLDPALVRPGRVDIDVVLDYATDYQIEHMYRRWHPEGDWTKFRDFIRGKFQDKVTTAQLQQELMTNKLGQY